MHVNALRDRNKTGNKRKKPFHRDQRKTESRRDDQASRSRQLKHQYSLDTHPLSRTHPLSHTHTNPNTPRYIKTPEARHRLVFDKHTLQYNEQAHYTQHSRY